MSHGEDEHSFLQRLLKDGKRVEATSQTIDTSKRPQYYDQERFKRAQKICRKYYTNLSLGSSTGLLMLLQVESILVPLLKSGKSRTVEHLYDRYTATAKFVRQWYESDFPEEDTPGRKAINLVRSMHQRIHKFMNSAQEAMKLEDGRELWVNQYDMALTQFAFIGLFLLYPVKCVAYRVTRDELSDVAYYWRLISYYLGIEERFNIFSECDQLDRQLRLMELLLGHMNELRLQPNRDQTEAKSGVNGTGRLMAEGVTLAFEDFNKESSFNILNHWWSPEISLSGDNQLQPYTLEDRWKLLFFLFYFKILFRSEWLMSYLNGMYKRKFDKFCADSDKIKPKLAAKYKDILYEM